MSSDDDSDTCDTPAGLRYLRGLGNHIESESVPGSLPRGRNNPRLVPLGLYAEQLSGTAFTAPRCDNRRVWLYRKRPSASGTSSQFAPCGGEGGGVGGSLPSFFGGADWSADMRLDPNPMRWGPAPAPAGDEGGGVNFVRGARTMLGSGDPARKSGLGIYVYACDADMSADSTSMCKSPRSCACVCNSSALTRIIENTKTTRTGLPHRAAAARPGDTHRAGTDGRRTRRDLRGAPRRRLLGRPPGSRQVVRGDWLREGVHPRDLQGALQTARAGSHRVQRAGERAGLSPSRRGVRRRRAVHDREQVRTEALRPDQSAHALRRRGVAGQLPPVQVRPLELLRREQRHLRPPRSEHIHRPDRQGGRGRDGPGRLCGVPAPRPGHGREHAAPAVVPPKRHDGVHGTDTGGVRRQEVEVRRGGGFRPGGASLHGVMTPHGPDAESYRSAVSDPCDEPKRLDGGLAFMFETSAMCRVSRHALECRHREVGYARCWDGLESTFTGEEKR
ncbi:hypothetical protein THAOC_02769 [Thalassiosira oceanica]|uniref:homogentisate 1,2-dioxygenase n=1 Tax=Thalassiosira oceanica TaxID=159749 RepID=K0TQ64_THAOC|nr:hypothetical protein THAOC_02769 [Thalassiosira oceanica]|eukprot:EJK75502.1 hypothetical protein THAOC_02769 [Thalassiosira oceanica]